MQAWEKSIYLEFNFQSFWDCLLMDQFSNILLSGLFRGISLLIPAGPSSASDSDRGYTNSRTEMSFISLMTFMLASQQLKNYVARPK